MNVPYSLAQDPLDSLSAATTPKGEIETTLQILPEIISKLVEMSLTKGLSASK
jgi:hypothetical protein